MSGIEIERKFLVRKGEEYKKAAFAMHRMEQGYMPCLNATVRVRICDERAYLTIKAKSKDGGLSRYEFEKEIAMDEAAELMKLCVMGRIVKTRYKVRHEGHIFEIDEFGGENQGLVLAEVELQSADEAFEKPDFIGKEVTGDSHFYNKSMLVNPYSAWKDIVPEEYRH